MYIDAHAHLDKYDETELRQVVGQIEADQIITLSVSMDPAAYLKSKALPALSKWVVPSFGIHPWNAPEAHHNLQALDKMITESPMVGEIGLDYHFVIEPEKYELQRDVFKYFVKQGVAQDKILNIHSKGAEADVDFLLGDLGAKRAILHWYSGPISELHKLTEKGFYVTVGVEMLLDPHIQTIAKAVPPHLLLTETDNPGGYQWLTGTTGTPVLIKSVVEELSELRGWRHEQTKDVVFENFNRLAGDDEWVKQMRLAIPFSRAPARTHKL
jgi:TatD DNase family protein